MLLIGLDPGACGALAVLQPSPWRLLATAAWDVRKGRSSRAAMLDAMTAELEGLQASPGRPQASPGLARPRGRPKVPQIRGRPVSGPGEASAGPGEASAGPGEAIPWREAIVVTETTGSRPGQGIAGTHRFGLGQGVIEGWLAAQGCRFIRVSPAKWKRQLGLGSDKRESIRLVQAFTFGLRWRVKDHNLAEAVLLAVWYAFQEAHREIRPREAGKWGLLQ